MELSLWMKREGRWKNAWSISCMSHVGQPCLRDPIMEAAAIIINRLSPPIFFPRHDHFWQRREAKEPLSIYAWEVRFGVRQTDRQLHFLYFLICKVGGNPRLHSNHGWLLCERDVPFDPLLPDPIQLPCHTHGLNGFPIPGSRNCVWVGRGALSS